MRVSVRGVWRKSHDILQPFAHTHPKQILSIYTACCLFVHRDTRPHGVTCRRHNIHVFCLSVRKKSHSSEIHQINVLMSQENTLYFHVHVKKITVCS